MKEILIKLNACKEAQEWAADKTWDEIYETCHRGDWLLWLFHKTNFDDLQLLTLAKGHCANTVRHLMKNEKSIAAVDAAIAFGEGQITREELASAYAASAAYAADCASYASAAYAASAADCASAYAAAAAGAAAAASAADCAYAYASASASAAAAAGAAAGAYAYASAEKKANQQLTADICRKYLPIEKWNINKQD